MKFCVNCQTNSSHLKFFTLPPVVAVVTIIRYGYTILLPEDHNLQWKSENPSVLEDLTPNAINKSLWCYKWDGQIGLDGYEWVGCGMVLISFTKTISAPANIKLQGPRDLLTLCKSNKSDCLPQALGEKKVRLRNWILLRKQGVKLAASTQLNSWFWCWLFMFIFVA